MLLPHQHTQKRRRRGARKKRLQAGSPPAAPNGTERAAGRLPSNERRLLAVTLLFLLALGICEARLYVLAQNADAGAAARRQSLWTQQLTDGRGMFFDHALRPLTNAVQQPAAVICAGTPGYDSLFSLTLPEDRPLLYNGVGSRAPFVVRLSALPAIQNGVFTFSYPVRYSDVPLARHIIGYCSGEGIGVSGLEKTFDDYLRGGGDTLTVECTTDARSQAADSTPRLRCTQGSGHALQLTLDTVIQRICEDVAQQTMTTGAIVVLESRTGRIKGCVSMPQFDPNNVYQSIQAQDTALINRAFSSYNVGSVYKPLLAAAALEKGTASLVYDCTGSIEVDGHTYRCARREGHGTVDLTGALQASCNCYFIRLGQLLGAQELVTFSALCGLGSATPLGGGSRSGRGNLPDVQTLANSGELAGLSFGQGQLTATPLQMAAAFNVFANDGVYISPSLVEGKVDGRTGQVTESLYRPQQLQVLSPAHAAEMRAMLVSVVEEGLGAGAAIPEARVGGKTGTAQTGRTKTNDDGSETELYESWFVGFYPAEQPQYTIAVMMDSTDRMGEEVAPVFAAVCRQLYYLQAA